MTWSVRYTLWKMRRSAEPDRAYSHALEASLRQKTGHNLWWVPIGRIAAAIASLTLVVGGATGVYAYTSDSVLPDHVLYPVRQAIEQAQVAATFSPEQRAVVKASIAARHAHELELMQARDQRSSQTSNGYTK